MLPSPREQQLVEIVERIGETAANEAECVVRRSIKSFYNASTDEIREMRSLATNYGISLP